MIHAQVTRGMKLPIALRQAIPALASALEREVLALGLKLSARVKEKLSGEVLKVRTGRLRRSIHLEMERSSNAITAVVGTNVSYARLHELGHHVPGHVVQVRQAKALRFLEPGGVVFAKQVYVPPYTLKQRSFLQSSLAEMTPEILQRLSTVARAEVRQVFTKGVE